MKEYVKFINNGVVAIRNFFRWFTKFKRRNHEKDVDKAVNNFDVSATTRILRDILRKRNKRRDES